MLCPDCNLQMHHLNNGEGMTEPTRYHTWDRMQCPKCLNIYLEYYHTQLLSAADMHLVPVVTLVPPENK